MPSTYRGDRRGWEGVLTHEGKSDTHRHLEELRSQAGASRLRVEKSGGGRSGAERGMARAANTCHRACKEWMRGAGEDSNKENKKHHTVMRQSSKGRGCAYSSLSSQCESLLHTGNKQRARNTGVPWRQKQTAGLMTHTHRVHTSGQEGDGIGEASVLPRALQLAFNRSKLSEEGDLRGTAAGKEATSHNNMCNNGWRTETQASTTTMQIAHRAGVAIRAGNGPPL